MRYSTTFAKTAKESRDFDSINATLLQKAGFVHQNMAGVYSFLPLGNRVLRKIENIVKEEMDQIAEEVFLPAISSDELWKKTGRFYTTDIFYRVSALDTKDEGQVGETLNRKAHDPIKRKHDPKARFVLNPTHEEVITPIVRNYARSYKDLPFAVYQIQSKFRNEARPRSGLMRCREFRMKDLYSFHTTEEDLMRFYNNEATVSYKKVFRRMGLGNDTYEVYSSGGDFTKQYSKEFQTMCETGEDLVFRVPRSGVCYNQEVAPSKAPSVEQDSEIKKMKVVNTPGVIGMEDLPEFLGVPAERCMKTLIYQVENGDVIVAAVRGTYDVNEIKLAKVAEVGSLELASDEVVQRVTGAQVGYAGIVNLPNTVRLFVDESMEDAVNFECGANKTDHHNLNVNWDVDVAKPDRFYDIKIAQEGDINPDTKEVYETFKASEVGNIFPLNTKFTDAFGYRFVDKDDQEKPVYMGSYGIGTSRLMGVIAEKYHDEKGLVWPITVAPFQVHLFGIGNGFAVNETVKKTHAQLTGNGVDVLWDDRQDVSAGVKFNDADLIGVPIRIVVSDRSLEMDSVEIKLRSEDEAVNVRLKDAWGYVRGKMDRLESEVMKS